MSRLDFRVWRQLFWAFVSLPSFGGEPPEWWLVWWGLLWIDEHAGRSQRNAETELVARVYANAGGASAFSSLLQSPERAHLSYWLLPTSSSTGVSILSSALAIHQSKNAIGGTPVPRWSRRGEARAKRRNGPSPKDLPLAIVSGDAVLDEASTSTSICSRRSRIPAFPTSFIANSFRRLYPPKWRLGPLMPFHLSEHFPRCNETGNC